MLVHISVSSSFVVNFFCIFDLLTVKCQQLLASIQLVTELFK